MAQTKRFEQTQPIPAPPESTPPPPARERRSLGVAAVGRTHIGNVRELNEDQFLIAQLEARFDIVQASFETTPPRPLIAATLLVVADGMGGHPAGEQASALAVSAIKHVIATSLGSFAARANGSEILHALRQGFTHADATLARVTAEQPQLAGMGTTMTAAFIRGNELFLGHAGDSRAYLYRQSRLMPLTKDHTVARALVEAGVLGEGQSSSGAWSHVVTNAVGGGAGGAKPELTRVQLLDGDRVLLCTDGLTRMVPSSEIAAELEDRDLGAVADRLIARALARGGVDNVTAVLASILAK